jgi:hypothetical protein
LKEFTSKLDVIQDGLVIGLISDFGVLNLFEFENIHSMARYIPLLGMGGLVGSGGGALRIAEIAVSSEAVRLGFLTPDIVY